MTYIFIAFYHICLLCGGIDGIIFNLSIRQHNTLQISDLFQNCGLDQAKKLHAQMIQPSCKQLKNALI